MQVVKVNKNLSDKEILLELGNRIKIARIRKGLTQSEFAAVSGVSKGTVANVEGGESIQLANLLKILRELDALNALEVLLPSSEKSPMELIYEKTERQRQRVRKSGLVISQNNDGWKWGEDK